MKVKKALVIDDEQDLCMLLKLQLNEIGIQTSVANTIEETYKKFDPDEHNLIFLDINLPDGNGIDLIPFLRSKKKSTIIIVISAYNAGIEHKNAFDAKGTYFLRKPFSGNDVIEFVEKVLS